jgi:hypothetical protein
MSTISQRIACAFAVLRGQYGDLTAMAMDREQSRQSLYRESTKVVETVEAVEGSAAQARIDDLRQQLADREAENQALRRRLERAVEITRDKQEEFAAVAQAEGVSLGVARRLLNIVAGSEPTPTWRRWAGRRSRPAGMPGPCSKSSTRRPASGSSRPPPMRFFGPKPALMVVEPLRASLFGSNPSALGRGFQLRFRTGSRVDDGGTGRAAGGMTGVVQVRSRSSLAVRVGSIGSKRYRGWRWRLHRLRSSGGASTGS